MEERLEKLIRDIPKAENHVHLEGAVKPELILRFAKRNNVQLPFSDEEGAKKYIIDNTQSLDTFINVFNVVNSVLRTEIDFYELVMEFAKDAQKENIIYREAMFNYAVHATKAISLETIMKGLSDARVDALRKYGVDICYIAELDRSKNSEWTCDFIRKISKYKETAPVVAVGWALGLEGAEDKNYKAKEFGEAFALATELGFRKTAHCGEAQGPESVWEVLEHLDIDRIDHGVRASEDEELVKVLAEKDILLAICPSTNIMINLYPDFAHHPLKYFRDSGVAVSVSTDDPGFILDDLTNEYMKVVVALDFTETDVIDLIKNSFKYSFTGTKYLASVDKWLDENGYA
jgi:adenosine deaminase